MVGGKTEQPIEDSKGAGSDAASGGAVPVRIASALSRGALWTLVVLTLGFLLATLEVQRRTNEPASVVKELVAKRQVLPISDFRATFLSCAPGQSLPSCETVRDGDVVSFPDVNGVASAVSSLPRPATHVVLRHALTAGERRWIGREDAFTVILVRAVQAEATLLGRNPTRAFGNGSTLTFATDASTLEDPEGNLALSFLIDGLPWFGPGEFPVFLVSQEATATVQGLAATQATAADRGRQLQLAIPFVLAVLALVIDHSPLFRVLAFLAGIRATRAFASVLLETPMGESFIDAAPKASAALVGSLNGAMAVSFVLIALAFAGTPANIARRVRRVLPILFVAFIAHSLLVPSAWVHGDVLADGLGAGAASVVLAGALVRRMFASTRTPTDEDVSNADPLLTVSMETRGATSRRRAALRRLTHHWSLAIGATVFGLLSYASFGDMLESGPKALIDWRYALIYPGMLLLAFARVGASSRVIRTLSDDLVRKSLLEGELAAAAAQMRAMQGPRKGRAAGVSWRVWQRQCVSVGGDFYDVRPLSFQNDETLVFALLADVTGHGLNAALVANTIGVAWGHWCGDVTRERRRKGETEMPADPRRACPKTTSEKEDLLRFAVKRILDLLDAGRVTGSATLLVAVLDPRDGSVSLCNVGHPQALAMGESGHRTLSCLSRLYGAKGPSAAEGNVPGFECRTYALRGETMFLYSDGLFPEAFGINLHSFLKYPRIRSTDPRGVHRPDVMWRRFREVQRHYTNHKPADEDDISLVALRFEVEAGQAG